MLGSEPQSEVEVAEHQILGRVQSSSGPGSRTGTSDPESGGSKNGVKLVAILNPFDKNHKNLRTLKQHYYPEGGWGWVITFCCFLVNIFTTGLQLSFSVLYLEIIRLCGTICHEDKISVGKLILLAKNCQDYYA